MSTDLYYKILALPAVTVPDPKAPDAKDVNDKLEDASDAASSLSPDALKLISIGIVAVVLVILLKKPAIRYGLLGAIVLAIVISAMN